jgi:hypothetical protein
MTLAPSGRTADAVACGTEDFVDRGPLVIGRDIRGVVKIHERLDRRGRDLGAAVGLGGDLLDAHRASFELGRSGFWIGRIDR